MGESKRPPPVRATPEMLGHKHVVRITSICGKHAWEFTFMGKLSARALRKALECCQEHVNGEFTIDLREEKTR